MWKDYSMSFIRKNRSSARAITASALIATFFLSLLITFFYNIWRYELDTVILKGEELQGNIYRDVDGSAPGLLKPFYFIVVLIVCISLIMIIHNSFAVSMNARVHQLGILSSIGATPGQIRAALIQEAAALCVLPVLCGSLLGIAGAYGGIYMVNILAAKLPGRHDVSFYYHPYVFALTILISLLTVLISAWIPAVKLAGLTPLEAVFFQGREGDSVNHCSQKVKIGLKRKRNFSIFSLLFGIEGEVAKAALKAQRKSLKAAAISLTFSFLGFTIMMCFFKLSDISTNYTYFARYKDVWDVMITVKDVKIEDFDLIEKLQESVHAQRIESCAIYQRAQAAAYIPVSAMSKEVQMIGGVTALDKDGEAVRDADNFYKTADEYHKTTEGYYKTADEYYKAAEGYIIKSPLIILDDREFARYCRTAGITPRNNGAIVINRIWNSIDSNFREREFMPYLKENLNEMFLQINEDGENRVKIPILGYTDIVPELREEYDDYVLVHVLPLTLWEDISVKIMGDGMGVHVEPNIYIRILDKKEDESILAGESEEKSENKSENEVIDRMNIIEESTVKLLGQKYEVESENRIQEKITNDRILMGYKLMLGSFCTLLAIIGIANIFAYTMGFLHQRRREFARYVSVGMTPAQLKKMFCLEIALIAGRPIAITFFLTFISVEIMIKLSYIKPMEFWRQAPFLPVLIFIAIVFAFVAAAYYIGGRRVLRDNLVEALRNDVM